MKYLTAFCIGAVAVLLGIGFCQIITTIAVWASKWKGLEVSALIAAAVEGLPGVDSSWVKPAP